MKQKKNRFEDWIDGKRIFVKSNGFFFLLAATVHFPHCNYQSSCLCFSVWNGFFLYFWNTIWANGKHFAWFCPLKLIPNAKINNRFISIYCIWASREYKHEHDAFSWELFETIRCRLMKKMLFLFFFFNFGCNLQFDIKSFYFERYRVNEIKNKPNFVLISPMWNCRIQGISLSFSRA